MIEGKIQVKPATIDDFHFFYNEYPTKTIKAWTGWLNGDRVGIGGFVKETGKESRTLFFHVPDIEYYNKMTLWRAIVTGVKELKKTGFEFNAVRDTELESSKRFLSYFGFRPSYMAEGYEVWL